MRVFILFLLFFKVTVLYSQQISGAVVDGRSDTFIPNVKITDESTGSWTISDEKGQFSIVSEKGTKLIFSKSGWIDESISINESSNKNIVVRIFPATIRIPEVQLTAKKNNFSSIEIKEEALQKIQSFSLGDVLQQLPGQYIQPINNTEMKNIVLRSANAQSVLSSSVLDQDFGNKAFGTQIMVNDIAISNNSNMQSYSPASGNPFTVGFYVDTNKGNITSAQPNYGTDLRQIPTEDIEKIEVIAGIPDAKYGDLTSGLIKVETKTGKRPLQLLTSIVEGTYQLGVSKGFDLNKKGDALNVSLNYLNSKSDPRFSDVTYERYTTSLLWSTTNKLKSWRNKLGINLTKDLNEGQEGEDEYHGLYIKSENKTIALTNNTNYKLDDSNFIRTINSNIGVTYGEQFSQRRNFLNTQGVPYGTALENSVYYANYTDPQYFNINNVDGKPINIFADIDANTILKSKNGWVHNFVLGINYRLSDNFGKGRYGTVGQFSTLSASGNVKNGTRDFDFSLQNIAMTQFSTYLQDNITKRFENKHLLNLNIGARYDLQNGYSVVSPRLNTSYKIKNVMLRGGIGLATKAPSLNQVYTGPKYLDLLLGDYRLPGVYSVAIIQTVVIPANNVDLKPSKSWRSELGFDWKLPFANFSLTGYSNLLFDGFTTGSKIIELDKSNVEIHNNGTVAPTFSITGTEKMRQVISFQTNSYRSLDKGMEMMVSFKKIESLNLTIGVKGSYVETISSNENEVFSKATIDDPVIAYGIFKPYETISKVSRAGLSLDYHIPRAGLIISINSDHFLLDSRLWEGDKNPVAYLDNNLVRHTVTSADLENPVIKSFSSNIGFVDSGGRTDFSLNGKTFHNFHLRISKDFLSGVRISIYLNNMFNLKVYNSYGYKYTGFTPISFGGNMSYQF